MGQNDEDKDIDDDIGTTPEGGSGVDDDIIDSTPESKTYAFQRESSFSSPAGRTPRKSYMPTYSRAISGLKRLYAYQLALKEFLDDSVAVERDITLKTGETYKFMKVNNNIYCISKIGEGGYGKVYKVMFDPSGIFFNPIAAKSELLIDLSQSSTGPKAIKVIQDEGVGEEEIKIASKKQQITNSGRTDDDRIFIEMKLFDGDLEGSYVSFSNYHVPTIWEYYRTMLRMCQQVNQTFFHDMIIHRDIKPANFLVTKDGQVQQSDWGLSVDHKGKFRVIDKLVGTIAYHNFHAVKDDYTKCIYDSISEGHALLISFTRMIQAVGAIRDLSKNNIQKFIKSMQVHIDTEPAGIELGYLYSDLYHSFQKEISSNRIIVAHCLNAYLSGHLNYDFLADLEVEISTFLPDNEEMSNRIRKYIYDCESTRHIATHVTAEQIVEEVKCIPLILTAEDAVKEHNTIKMVIAIKNNLSDLKHRLKEINLMRHQINNCVTIMHHRYIAFFNDVFKNKCLQVFDGENEDHVVRLSKYLAAAISSLYNSGFEIDTQPLVDICVNQLSSGKNVSNARLLAANLHRVLSKIGNDKQATQLHSAFISSIVKEHARVQSENKNSIQRLHIVADIVAATSKEPGAFKEFRSEIRCYSHDGSSEKLLTEKFLNDAQSIELEKEQLTIITQQDISDCVDSAQKIINSPRRQM